MTLYKDQIIGRRLTGMLRLHADDTGNGSEDDIKRFWRLCLVLDGRTYIELGSHRVDEPLSVLTKEEVDRVLPSDIFSEWANAVGRTITHVYSGRQDEPIVVALDNGVLLWISYEPWGTMVNAAERETIEKNMPWFVQGLKAYFT